MAAGGLEIQRMRRGKQYKGPVIGEGLTLSSSSILGDRKLIPNATFLTDLTNATTALGMIIAPPLVGQAQSRFEAQESGAMVKAGEVIHHRVTQGAASMIETAVSGVDPAYMNEILQGVIGEYNSFENNNGITQTPSGVVEKMRELEGLSQDAAKGGETSLMAAKLDREMQNGADASRLLQTVVFGGSGIAEVDGGYVAVWGDDYGGVHTSLDDGGKLLTKDEAWERVISLRAGVNIMKSIVATAGEVSGVIPVAKTSLNWDPQHPLPSEAPVVTEVAPQQNADFSTYSAEKYYQANEVNKNVLAEQEKQYGTLQPESSFIMQSKAIVQGKPVEVVMIISTFVKDGTTTTRMFPGTSSPDGDISKIELTGDFAVKTPLYEAMVGADGKKAIRASFDTENNGRFMQMIVEIPQNATPEEWVKWQQAVKDANIHSGDSTQETARLAALTEISNQFGNSQAELVLVLRDPQSGVSMTLTTKSDSFVTPVAPTDGGQDVNVSFLSSALAIGTPSVENQDIPPADTIPLGQQQGVIDGATIFAATISASNPDHPVTFEEVIKQSTIKEIGGAKVLVSLEGFPFAIQLEGGEWKKLNFSETAKLFDLDIVVRNSSNRQATLDVATSIKMEIGDVVGLYNSNFDWAKVTNDWDNVKRELEQGKIPFESQIFNPKKVSTIYKDIKFAQDNHLAFVGDALFYPSMLQNPAIKNLTPENQKKVLFFMAAAKLLEFPEMSKIDLAAEISAFQMWRSGEFNEPFKQLGGTDFLVELAAFAKQIKPDIKLVITEDMIIDGRVDIGDFNKHYKLFFDLLKELKVKNAQIDGVKFENTLWVGSPPTEESILKPINEAQALGFEIEAPDLIVGLGEKSPIWTNWSPTIKLNDETEMQQEQAKIYALVLRTYLKAGIKNFGFHSITDKDDWLKATSNIFDSNGSPKLSEFELMKAAFEILQ